MTNPETEFTATLAERTIVVSWPDNERGGAVLPPDNWQERARDERTLHEIDEGSISGCSVLRWRDDPRTDAELLAVSLALVTGKPAAVSVPPPAPQAAARRARYAAAIAEGFRAFDADTTSDAYLDAELLDAVVAVADAEEAELLAAVPVVPPATNQAALLQWAADRLDADMERFFSEWPDEPRNSPYALGRKDASSELRRLAAVSVPPPATRADDQRCAVCQHVDDGSHPAVCFPPAPADRADRVAVLAEVADWLKAWRPEFFERWAITEQERYEGGVDDAAAELRRLADEAQQPGGPCVAGEQQNETPEAETGCAHCGKTIRLITGTLAAWWVHDPGGHTICVPEQAASSPRATPKAAAGVQDGAAS